MSRDYAVGWMVGCLMGIALDNAIRIAWEIVTTHPGLFR